MGFSSYASTTSTKEKVELRFVETEKLHDTDSMYVALGHYEGAKGNTKDKLYMFSKYTDKSGNLVTSRQADIKIDMDKAKEFYEVFKKFMES